MAIITVELPITESAYLDQKRPDTNLHNVDSAEITTKVLGPGEFTSDGYLLFKFDSTPLQGRRIDDFTIKGYCNLLYTSDRKGFVTYGHCAVREWDALTVTYNTAPLEFPLVMYDNTHIGWYADIEPEKFQERILANLSNGSHEDDEARKILSKAIQFGITVFPSYGKNVDGNTSQRISIMAPQNPTYPFQISADCYPATPVVFEKSPQEDAHVSALADIAFRWRIQGKEVLVFGDVKQASAVFYWRVKGETEQHQIHAAGSECTCIVPAGTFPSNQTVEWMVEVTTQDGETGGEDTWTPIVTTEVLSNAKAVSPKDVYISSDVPQKFSWEHIITTGTAQTKAELQYSLNQPAWMTFWVAQGPKTSATVPAETLPGGNLSWRVRTYNADGAAGEWSEPAQIVVQGPPGPPTLNEIIGEPRPVIGWAAAGQIAYQLQILQGDLVLLDTGEIAGTDSAFTPNEYLSPGIYAVRLRVKSSVGVWSVWASGAFEVPESQPDPPRAAYAAEDGFVRVTVENASDYAKLYLLRNGMPVAKFAGHYLDYAAEAQQSYLVRGVDAQDRFADSPPVQVACPIRHGARLAAASEPDKMLRLLLRRGEAVGFDWETSFGGTAVHYAGRTHPVYYFGEGSEESHTLNFSVKTPQEYDALAALLRRRETLLCRDRYGGKFYGAAGSVSVHRDQGGTDFTLSLTRVDYIERIAYDPKEAQA